MNESRVSPIFEHSATVESITNDYSHPQFDKVLAEVEAGQGLNEDIVGDLTVAICNIANISSNSGSDARSLGQLFRHEHSDHQKALIATSLLSVTHLKSDLLPKEFEYRVFGLYDEVFQDNIYRENNITPRDQTYRKITVLSQTIEAFDEKLWKIPTQVDLATIPSLQQNFLRSIKSKKASVLLSPFVSLDLIEESFKKSVAHLAAYNAANGSDAVEKYKTAQSSVNAFATICELRSNKYTFKLLRPLAAAMQNCLDEDFQSSPFGKEAEVQLSACDKKYPRDDTGTVSMRCFVDVLGSGMALDLTVTANEITGCDLQRTDSYLGNVEPGRVMIEFPVIAKSSVRSYIGDFNVEWRSGNSESQKRNFLLEFFTQDRKIDWKSLKSSEPYTIDEVDSVDDFVGRSELLTTLEALVTGTRVGSAFIAGQKRVGKTSLAKTLQSILAARNDDSIVIYVEGGLYIRPTPQATIGALGSFLVSEINFYRPELAEMEQPVFTDAFSPFVEYLRRIKRISPTFRALFILDEFDELPIDLYRPNEISNSFFLSLRSVSNERDFGFVMVGGEKMPYILNCQGHALNKYESFSVDYFDKNDQWSDFVDLVRRPTSNVLEISDEAVVSLYEKVNGHPYYTKLIGRKLFRIMRDRRDYHVTEQEVQEAFSKSIEDVRGNSFQHFWTDGIFEPEPRAESVRTERRRFLIALAECLDVSGNTTRDKLIKAADRTGLSEEEARRILQTFLTRDVLVESDGILRCKVPFFSEWLTRQGTAEIITTMSTLDAVLEYKKKEQEATVRSAEIVALCKKWGSYAGRSISEDHVRTWLAQFGDHFRQRSMFEVVSSLRFYDEGVIRTKMLVANGIITRGRMQRLESKKLKRDDIFVSYVDGPGKSGSRYAKLYADENGIYQDNILEKGSLLKSLRHLEKNYVLVFVDDFVGTGNSVSGYLEQLAPVLRELQSTGRATINFIALCGFQDGLKAVDDTIAKHDLRIRTNCMDSFGDEERCFSAKSRYFRSEAERIKAREIAYEIGLGLEKSAPLGYGQSESAVIFEDSCPNNNLPILWSKHRNWVPLFRRI